MGNRKRIQGASNKTYWTPEFSKVPLEPLMHVGEIWKRVFHFRDDSSGYFNNESYFVLVEEHPEQFHAAGPFLPEKEPLVTGHLYYEEDFVILETYKGENYWIRILVSGSGFVGWLKVYAKTWEKDYELVWC